MRDPWYKSVTSQIERYCAENNLDFTRLMSSPRSWNNQEEYVFFLHYDKDKGKNGLMDEAPMPVVLKVYRQDGRLIFEQTEHTGEFLKKGCKW